MNFAEQMKEKAEKAIESAVLSLLQSQYEKIDGFINEKAEKGRFRLVVELFVTDDITDAKIVQNQDTDISSVPHMEYGEDYCVITGVPCEQGLEMAVSFCGKHYKNEGFKVKAYIGNEDLSEEMGMEGYFEKYAIIVISWDDCEENKNESSDND